jgi:hypothetical protein
VDPAARNSWWGSHTNDLNPNTGAQWHLHAVDYLSRLDQVGQRFHAALLDLPYSPRQVRECYENVGRPVGQHDVQSLWRSVKDATDLVLLRHAIVICCGWDSNGMGLRRGYELIEVLLVAHGADHHDTIVTVERKLG